MIWAELPRTKSLAAAVLAACLLLLLLAGAAAAQPSGRYTLTGKEVAIYNLIGKVAVVAGSGAEVEVQVTAGGPDAAKLSVETGEIDARETLRVLYPGRKFVDRSMGLGSSTQLEVNEDGTFSGEDRDSRRVLIHGRGDGLEAHADLTIRVPAGKRVRVYQAIGDVTAEGVTADLRLDTAGAPVSATRIRGSLHIDVGSGEVHVSDVDGNLSIDTGSGEVTVEKVRGDVVNIDSGSGRISGAGISAPFMNVDTGSGEIVLTGITAEEVSLDTGSGAVSVDFTSDIETLAIDTGSGSVRVGVPADVGAEVHIETASGDVDVAVPHDAARDRGSSYRCILGDGEGKIVIDTGSGSVTIEKS